MSTSDDRPWKAEEMLRVVIEAPDGDDVSTRDRINEYLDGIDQSVADEAATLSTPPNAGPPRSSAAGAARRELPPEPPISVPNHVLLRRLGAGGFGQVWLAKHTLTQHHRACKLVPADKAVELDGLRHLKQRVPAHPNLLPIEEVGASGGWLYCLMPLADSASSEQAVLDHNFYEPLTLDVYLARHGRRRSAEAASIGLALAEAVRHLHNHGVTHGDIKPGNMMRLGGRWTLADYGLARELSSPRGTGQTPAFTPPEGPGSTFADQFAIGVVLMELVVNWPARMLDDFRTAPIDRFKLDDQGPRLIEIILRATAHERHDRFGSIDELIEALRPLSQSDRGHVRRRGPWRIAAFATLAAAVLIGTVLYVNRCSSTAPSSPAVAPPYAPVLTVEAFEVWRYPYDPRANNVSHGAPINADNFAAREDDDVTFHARFSAPAHFYLLSLDPDGQVKARLPALTTAPAVDHVDYPCQSKESPDGDLYRLDTGPGTQGFMLLVSENPLPPWPDWVAAHGAPTWSHESLPADCVILFDGVETRYLGATRGPMPRRGRLVPGPIDWARAQEDLPAVSVRFIAFPVLPKGDD